MAVTLASEKGFQSRDTTEQTFTFAMTDLGEMVFMPKILRHIRSRRAARGRSAAVAASAAQIERGLESGEIDLAVGYFPGPAREGVPRKAPVLPSLRVPAAGQPSDHRQHAVDRAVPEPRTRRRLRCRVARYEIFERFLRAKKIQRRVALETPHFLSIPSIISQSDLVVTVPHAVGVFVTSVHMNIRIAQPPVRTPKIDLKLHWHRNFQRDPKNRWLRELVAGLFTDETDEWR